jgi:hypothetical protein
MTVQRLRRPSLATALAVLATVVALASVVHSSRHVWHHLIDQHRVYGSYSDTQRRHAPIDSLGLPSDIFDFYRQYVVPGDRVYFQVRESGFSQFLDYQTAFGYVGRYYFLPARQATDLKDATVVVTYFEDPKQLHVPYITQQQAGLQPIYVSRIKAP